VTDADENLVATCSTNGHMAIKLLCSKVSPNYFVTSFYAAATKLELLTRCSVMGTGSLPADEAVGFVSAKCLAKLILYVSLMHQTYKEKGLVSLNTKSCLVEAVEDHLCRQLLVAMQVMKSLQATKMLAFHSSVGLNYFAFFIVPSVLKHFKNLETFYSATE